MLRLLLIYLTINYRVHSIVVNEISDDELKNAPPDHVIPYSEHEDPPEPSTKPKYNSPGEWAKSSNKTVGLEFVPTKLYAQVRQTHTRKRVPREEALRQARTDEEKNNAARLKEVVTNRKVNTVYTEEGYEDAAYDHGGHVRDADFNENYSEGEHESEPKKFKEKIQTNSDGIDDDDSVIPKIIIESEINKFEKDLSREDKGAAGGAETEVPDNLRDLADDSESHEVENKENNRATSGEVFKINSEEIPLTGESKKNPTILKKSQELFDDFDTVLPVHDFTPGLKQLSSSEDESSKNYGRIFWDYFKTTTELPQLINNSKIPEHEIEPKMEKQTVNTSENSKEETRVDPSLSQIYETWKQRGIEESYVGESPEHEETEIIQATTLASHEDSSEDDSEEQLDEKPKKNYMVMVRNTKKFRNKSKPTKSPGKYKNYNYNNLKDLKKIGTVKNITMIKSTVPLGLGQVMYADFLRPNGNMINPTVTQESRSLMEQTIPETILHSSVASADSSLGPATTPTIYHYHQHQRRHRGHQQQQRPLTQQNRKRQTLSLIKMLPPSPMSRSEYADYYLQRKNRSVKSDHEPSTDVHKNYQSVFHHDGKTFTRRKRSLTLIDKGLDSEKVLLIGVKNNYQSVEDKKFKSSRQKRNAQELLIKAPKIVDDVVNEEIKSRFPDNSHDNDDDYNDDDDDDDDEAEKSRAVNSNYEEQDKVEIEVPEYNFSNAEARYNDYDDDDDDDGAENGRIEAPPTEPVDNKKYPFYNDNQIARASPLKYVINPVNVPQKTHGGSEFYDSRDKYMKCDDIEANLSEELSSENKEPVPNRDLKENLPRLHGLGDKISCLRDKYFDKNPLDNPLFREKRIEAPEMPEELNPIALRLAFSTLVGDREANTIRRVSRKPEIIDLHPSNSQPTQTNELKNKNNPKTWNNHAKRYRGRQRSTTLSPDALYQRQVYEDVMGTIKNMAHMYQPSPSISKPITTPRISKTNLNINHSSELSRERDKNEKTIHITARPVASLSSKLTAPQIGWRYKLPYRNKRVSHKTRPRFDLVPGSNIPRVFGYLKSVRIHKRSVDSFNPNGRDSASNILARNATRQRRMRKSNSTTVPEVSTQASERMIYTIDDRLRHSKPRGRVRHGQFTTVSTILNAETRRGEPRYTPIRKFDDNVHKLEYLNKNKNKNKDSTDNIKDADDSETVGLDPKLPKEHGRRYDVYEDIQEESTEAPIILANDKTKESDPSAQYSEDEGSGVSEESSGVYHGEESRDDEKEDDDKENESNEDEQMERPSESYTKNTGDGSEEADDNDGSSRETHPYEDEEKNVFYKSEGEEEFERFKSRPFSPFESNHDEKYSDLGPRINKPAFHHPSFDSSESKKTSRYHGQSQKTYDESEESDSAAKYTFPWQHDDEDASEESRRYERITGKHEYPWERRERIARREGKWKDKDNGEASNEQNKSGTVIRFRKLYPWERYDLPSMGYGISRTGNFFSPIEFDNYGFSSQFRPVRFSSRYQSRLKPPKNFIKQETKEESVKNDANDTSVISTTYASQIPATSATSSSLIQETTTPSMKIDNSMSGYRVRSRLRSSTTPGSVQTTKSRSRRRRPSSVLLNDDEKLENSLGKKTRRRSRMTTVGTTSKPSSGRRRYSNIVGDGSTTPMTTRNIEHRSKVSKEEIITKMMLPDIEASDTNHEDSSPNNEMVEKVSIVTKETPEHIYRTEEIDRNGVKGTFFSILPNNNTESSLESDKILIDRIGMEETDKNENITGDSPGFDVSMSIPPKAKQLNEHGTRKIMSSVSWISENYDY